MKKPSEDSTESVRERLIGLGEKSIKKSHYRELKDRQHQMERFHALLDDANDAIILAEAKTLTLVDMNATACRLLGKDRRGLVGRPLAEMLPHPQGERLARYILHRDPGERRFPEIEAQVNGTGGALVDVGMTVNIHTFGGTDYAVVVARDVSERKAAEKSIHELNRKLEQMVEERTAKLNETIRDLDAFTYSVSHDLRSPLRIIEGFARILEEDYGSALDDEGGRFLSRIISSVRRMDDLITDLLHLSRVNRKDLEVRHVDMTALSREVYSDLTQALAGRNIHFVVAEDMSAEADPGLVRVLLTNLIGNALKFTANKGRAKIEVGTEKEEGRTVFFVRDNGAGFDPAYADKLFMPFKRLHSAEDFEGTGIGLAIVKRVVERHGGDIRGQGDVDKGASFHFTLSGD